MLRPRNGGYESQYRWEPALIIGIELNERVVRVYNSQSCYLIIEVKNSALIDFKLGEVISIRCYYSRNPETPLFATEIAKIDSEIGQKMVQSLTEPSPFLYLIDPERWQFRLRKSIRRYIEQYDRIIQYMHLLNLEQTLKDLRPVVSASLVASEQGGSKVVVKTEFKSENWQVRPRSNLWYQVRQCVPDLYLDKFLPTPKNHYDGKFRIDAQELLERMRADKKAFSTLQEEGENELLNCLERLKMYDQEEHIAHLRNCIESHICWILRVEQNELIDSLNEIRYIKHFRFPDALKWKGEWPDLHQGTQCNPDRDVKTLRSV